MALDIYVMPLHKFLSGDYISPLEEMFGEKAHRIGASKGRSTIGEARNTVGVLQDTLKTLLTIDSTWQDDGDTKGEQFDYAAFNALRAFAAHQDYPKSKGLLWKKSLPFDPVQDSADHPGVAKVWNGAPTASRHLILHADNQGFWFPIDFEHPLVLDRDAGLYAGSSFQLRAELIRLRRLLGFDTPWETLADGQTIAADDDAMGTIKYACALLLRYAELSCERSLPIVFDG